MFINEPHALTQAWRINPRKEDYANRQEGHPALHGVWPMVGAGPRHTGDRTFSWVPSGDPREPHSHSCIVHYKTAWKDILVSGC